MSPSISSAQIHDWLLEHYKIKTAERTTRRLVELLRETHKIKKISIPRSFEAIDELPMGYQMQVDFGQEHLRTPDGQYIKVHFEDLFCRILDTSGDSSRISLLLMGNLFKVSMDALSTWGGKPCELVFDQDSIVSVNENYGDIMFTYEFEQFKQAEKMDVYLCRKADPQSKGKVEPVVNFIKINFLENRYYMGIDLLNQSFESWLERTGNAKVHGTTKKVPAKVFLLEQEHLRLVPLTKLNVCEESITRNVRKDNTVLYLSNRYSVPPGTFGKEEEVVLRIEGEKLVIEQAFGDYVIAEHSISKEHMPEHHQKYWESTQYNGARYRAWASKIGENTAYIIDKMLTAQSIEEQAYKSCMGVLQIAKTYSDDRLEHLLCKSSRYELIFLHHLTKYPEKWPGSSPCCSTILA